MKVNISKILYNAIADWYQAYTGYAHSLHVSLHVAGSSTASMLEDVKQKACEGEYLKGIM